MLSRKGLPKGKVENESWLITWHFSTLYSGKRKGKGVETDGPFGEQLPGDGL